MKKDFSPFKQPPPRPPSVALDRFGKIVEPGHLVLVHSNVDLLFEVVDVRPVLNPSVAQGQAMQVTIRAHFPVQILSAHPSEGFVIVGESQARLEAKAANNGSAPEPAPPSGLALTDTEQAVGSDPVDADGQPHRVHTSRHGSED